MVSSLTQHLTKSEAIECVAMLTYRLLIAGCFGRKPHVLYLSRIYFKKGVYRDRRSVQKLSDYGYGPKFSGELSQIVDLRKSLEYAKLKEIVRPS